MPRELCRPLGSLKGSDDVLKSASRKYRWCWSTKHCLCLFSKAEISIVRRIIYPMCFHLRSQQRVSGNCEARQLLRQGLLSFRCRWRGHQTDVKFCARHHRHWAVTTRTSEIEASLKLFSILYHLIPIVDSRIRHRSASEGRIWIVNNKRQQR